MIFLLILFIFLLMILAFAMVQLPSTMVNKKHVHAHIMVIFCILIALAITANWMLDSDTILIGEKNTVGYYARNTTDRELTGVIYQSSDGKYFILKDDYWNIAKPNFRVYLDTEKTEKYLNSYYIIHSLDIDEISIK